MNLLRRIREGFRGAKGRSVGPGDSGPAPSRAGRRREAGADPGVAGAARRSPPPALNRGRLAPALGAGLALLPLLLAPGAWAGLPGYGVVVSRQTKADAGWNKVVEALREKHDATVIVFDTSVSEALPALRAQFPRYVCFVAQPSEVTRAFVAEVHRLTRRFDDDPYTDCFWGILTLEIKPNRGAKTFAPINQNGSQRGGRPIVQFLPQRVRDVQIVEGAELKPVITDDFILVPNPVTCDPATKYRVVFRAAARD